MILFGVNGVNDAQWKACEAVIPTCLNTRAGFMQYCDKKDTQVCKCVCAHGYEYDCADLTNPPTIYEHSRFLPHFISPRYETAAKISPRVQR